MLRVLYTPTVSSLSRNKSPFKSHRRLPPPLPTTHPPVLIRFPNSHRENLRYLKSLNITTTTQFTSPQQIDKILSLINYLKSNQSFTDPDIQTLALKSPKIFTSNLSPTDIQPLFNFLTLHLSTSPPNSRTFVLRCPNLLLSDVDHYIKPTFQFLTQLGIKNLDSPSSINAHLLNSRVDKFVEKMRYLESLGFSREEVRNVCVRFPAVFAYSVENNMRPKFEYLVVEMERGVGELKRFPQYFGFSLENRIVPRHLHLKERKVSVPLPKMLLYGDQKFYEIWK